MDEQANEQQKAEQTQNEIIKQSGGITARSARGTIHCLTVIGQIEGHQVLPAATKTTKYEHILPQLAAIEETPEIDGLLVLINTVGGDIEAGLAISELIAGMSKPTVSLVLGGGHSIGVPLAVAARRSFIAPSASMTIHPVRLTGVVIGSPQTFSYFEKVQERIIRFVTANSRISQERLREMMLKTGELADDVGSLIDGCAAVETGLIDRVGGLSDALLELHQMIDLSKQCEQPAAPTDGK